MSLGSFSYGSKYYGSGSKALQLIVKIFRGMKAAGSIAIRPLFNGIIQKLNLKRAGSRIKK